MKRDDLLEYIERGRAKRRSLTGGMALAVVAGSLFGGFRLSQGQADGWMFLLIFGLAPGAGLWLRSLEPAITYVSGRLEARRVWWRTLVEYASLVAVVVGCFAGFWAIQDILRVVFGFGGVIATAYLLLQVAGLFQAGPTLTVDGQGLWDKRVLRRRVGWDEVAGFDVVEKGVTAFYRLRLTDPDALNWPSRLGAGLGAQGPALNCLDLTCAPGDLLLAINAHRPSLLGEWPVSVAA